jgi:GTP:adenosylcobinamide-phosphate guanylyltransferase
LASAFIQKNLLDTQGLQLVLTKIEENQRSVNRQSVASASIPKVRLYANRFNIPTIDDSDTAYEDDQRLLLNSGFEEKELCKILHSMCWSNGDLFSTLPMRENYIRDVLVGYALEGASNLGEVSTSLSLGRVTDALSSAMVNYGPLGFTESANFEREFSLDSDIADKLRQIGGITTSRKLAEVLDSAMGRRFQEWLAGEEKIQTKLCADSAAKMTPRDSAILDFVRAVLSVCEVSVDGGDA